MAYPINVSRRGPAFLEMYSAVHGKSGPLKVLDRLIHQCDWCHVAFTSLDITVNQLWFPVRGSMCNPVTRQQLPL